MLPICLFIIKLIFSALMLEQGFHSLTMLSELFFKAGNKALSAEEFAKTEQLLVVAAETTGGSNCQMYFFEKSGGSWKQALPEEPCIIGRKGLALPSAKKEGDKKTPIGLYRLGFAFGYDKAIPTRMPYRIITVNDFWIDDPASKDYNRWVSDKPLSGSYEQMLRTDGQYSYGIVISYNENPVVKGRGSAIFIHVRKPGDSGTAGCIALEQKALLDVLARLAPEKHPMVLILPGKLTAAHRGELPAATKK